MGKRILGLFLEILFSLCFLNGQDNDSVLPVKIGGIEWNIAQRDNWKAGITREPALRKYFQMQIGYYFESAEILESSLELTTKNLNAQQIFSEITYKVEYRIEKPSSIWADNNQGQGDILIAYITISVKDAFSLYLLPYILYDSNLGTVYGGNFSYNNVLGTLTNVNAKAYWGMDTWKVGGSWENIPMGMLRGDLLLYDEFLTTKRVNDQDQTVLEFTNMILNISLGFNIPLGKGFSLVLKPGVFLPYNYELLSYDTDYGREEYDNQEIITSAFLTGGITYNNLYWKDQFRKGMEGKLLITGEGPGSDGALTLALDGYFSLFYQAFSFLGLGHNLSGFYIHDNYRDNAGQYIRGVLDHLMYGDVGIFLNNNVDFRAFIIPPLVDVHLYPLWDIAYVYNSNTPFNPHDFRMTAGFGITIYPLFLQSLQLNIEAGFDLEKGSKNEITFKSELFF